jgi:hypothetical protein
MTPAPWLLGSCADHSSYVVAIEISADSDRGSPDELPLSCDIVAEPGTSCMIYEDCKAIYHLGAQILSRALAPVPLQFTVSTLFA